MVIFFSSAQLVYFNHFLSSLHLNFFWFWNIPNHMLKKYTL